jgi:hypothetical protein
MQDDEAKEMFRLCSLIQTEQNPAKFASLLEQLNDLLECKEKRLRVKETESATQP